MSNRYIIKVETIDNDGVITTDYLTKGKRTYTTNSLSDAIDACTDAAKWVKGKYVICLITELNSLEFI